MNKTDRAPLILRGWLPAKLVDEAGDFLRRFTYTVDERGQFASSVRLDDRLLEIPRFVNAQPLLFEMFPDTKKLFMHMPPMARFVMPGHDAALWPMHQDTQYNDHLTGEFITMWIPLAPIVDEHSGAIASSDKVLAPLAMGDVVLLHSSTWHRSMPNRGEYARLSVDYRFWGEQTTSTKHYLDLAANKVVEPHDT